ncbi:NAD-glutamate dehydrogenase [Pseudomonas glycinae]|nr:NAD-glutamate dehydrogenase [Pseudomonas glycinae]
MTSRPTAHVIKELTQVLEVLPCDDLFQSPVDKRACHHR